MPARSGCCVEQRAGLPVIVRGVVMAFAQADDLEGREDLLEQMQEAHLALLVGAVAEAARDHRDLAGARADEAADQIAGGASGRAVVESDVGDAARIGEVRDQRDGRHAALGQHVDRFAHRRMLERHERDAVDLASVAQQPSREEFGIEALDLVDAAARR